MTLRTLLLSGAMAALLAGCSGGGASAPGGSSTVPAVSSNLAIAQVTFTMPAQPTQSKQRNAKYVAVGLNDIQYTFTPTVGSPITADIAVSPNSSGTSVIAANPSCTTPASGVGSQQGSGVTVTCNIATVPGSYTSLALTMQNCTVVSPPSGCTVEGTGTSTAGFTLVRGTPTVVPIQIAPGLTGGSAGPTLTALSGQRLFFIADGTTQSIALSANELDPLGNIITTYYGAVANWPGLHFQGFTNASSNSGIATNLASNPSGVPSDILAVPSGQNGNTSLITYYGNAGNTQDLQIALTDGTSTSPTLDIPFIGLTATFVGGASIPSTLTLLPGNSQSFTLTEATTSSTMNVPDLAAGFGLASYTTCATGTISVTPTLGVAHTINSVPNGSGALNGTLDFQVTVNQSNSPAINCQFVVFSVYDSNLQTAITLKTF